ncbi:aldo/keto reductase [Hyphobacterium sp.]|uniref:aldo/keto reductase n=1 Tax=Hyphobacterium sp. TaxID=2004662 RepID=UPI003BA961B8
MTDLPASVSRLGFGVSGPHNSDVVDPEKTIALVHEAYSRGITVFDTALKYGDGEAQRRLGQALQSLHVPRDSYFVITKVGILNEKNARGFQPDQIKDAVRSCVDTLGCGRVDLVLLQGPASEEFDAAFPALLSLKEAGDLRFAGVSGRDDELDLPLTHTDVDAIMAPHYDGLNAVQNNRLMKARESGKMVFGIEALSVAKGRFKLPHDRLSWWYFQRSIQRQRERQARIKAGLPVAPEAMLSVAAALRRSANSGLVDCVMVQTTKTTHLRANAAALGLDGGPADA